MYKRQVWQFYIQAALGTGIRSGLYIFILRQFFRNMPRELEEAACIDGCGPLKTFLRVMVPNVVPALLTITAVSYTHLDVYKRQLPFRCLSGLQAQVCRLALHSPF